MSRSLGWRPVSNTDNNFESAWGPSIRDKLEEVFGKRPITDEHLTKLRNFAEITGDEIYNEIADLILKVGAIQLVIQ